MSGPSILTKWSVPLTLEELDFIIDALEEADVPEYLALLARLHGYRRHMVLKLNDATSPMPADSETSC